MEEFGVETIARSNRVDNLHGHRPCAESSTALNGNRSACTGRLGTRLAFGSPSLPVARIVATGFLARAVGCLSSSARQTPSLFRDCTDQPARRCSGRVSAQAEARTQLC